MPVAHAIGANLPRWMFQGKRYYADRIYENAAGVLHLESGVKVEATPELLASGPTGYGDFYTVEPDENGAPTGAEKLFAGADFQPQAAPIPHALDIAMVSADPQPGRSADQPSSGSPDDPNARQDAQGNRDPIAEQFEKRAADESAKKQ